jgi:two-component system chemotaxis sensor kinase CheA
MPVGSHKDAFKAHQLLKKLISKQSKAVLARIAADALFDFVKNHRQINSESSITTFPVDAEEYDQEQLDQALHSVNSLCGQCEENHDNDCFVNQARRALIAAKTKVDLGSDFDGKKSLPELLELAQDLKSQKASPVISQKEPGDSTEPSDAEDSTALKEKLEAMQEKDVFRETLIDEVVETIRSVTEGNFATEMPVHEDAQLGKLATAFNLMLKTVDQTMHNLDSLVAERSAEMRMIMDTVPVGLFSIDESFKIHPEYSKSAEKILGLSNLRGRNIFDCLGLTNRRSKQKEQLKEYFDVLLAGMLPEGAIEDLNPFREMQLHNHPSAKECWIRLKYCLIESRQGQKQILVAIEDISQEKKLAQLIAESEKENTYLKAIAEDPDLFREFLNEMNTILKQSESDLKIIQSGNHGPDLIHGIFRGIHTIKGAAGSFGLSGISTITSTLEGKLNDLRQLQEYPAETIENAIVSLEKLNKEVLIIIDNTRHILGDDVELSDDIQLKVPLKQINKTMQIVSDMTLDSHYQSALLDNIRNLKEVPIRKGFARSLKIIPDLISRLKKDISFSFTDNDVMIDWEVANALNTALIHLIRNAMDHGIEDAEDRSKSGKPETGFVKLESQRNDSTLYLTISDDGQGLDAEKLKRKAVEKGLINDQQAAEMTDEQSYQLIFKPGFSTAQSVSDVSGRGVGLDAVLTTIKSQLKGSITISSQKLKGTTFNITIPYALKVQVLEMETSKA